MSKLILIVDDDALTRRSVAFNLEQAGFATSVAGSGEDALANAKVNPPDLILLDIGLPGMDGLETLRAFRQAVRHVPVIFVSARRRELDQIIGLELGADDYVTKPFDMDVLVAHIKAVIRRSTPVAATNIVNVGDLVIDVAAHSVHINRRLIELAPKEFDLLLVLAQNAGRVLSMDELLKQVWGDEWIGESQTLYVHVRWLREKIEEDPGQPRRLLTVRGTGYKLDAPLQA